MSQTTETGPYHPGERVVQQRAGGVEAANCGSATIRAEIPDVAADFLRQQRMVVVSARHGAGRVWVSALTGPAGFIEVADERTIVARTRLPQPDPLAGVFFATRRDFGMLAIEPQTRRRMRVNGTAVDEGDHLRFSTEQVYANCPKYIQTRDYSAADVQDARVPVALRGSTLSPTQQEWIRRADTFFVGTAAPGHGSDASHRRGNPGFVTVASERRLSWPDYVGNSMFMTLGNLELDPACGLLFLDWEHGHTLHLTGRASVDWNADRAATVPGALRFVDFIVDELVEIRHRLPLRWQLQKYSRFNPPVGPSPTGISSS